MKKDSKFKNNLQEAMKKKILNLYEHSLQGILEANPPLDIVTRSQAP